MQEGSTYFIIHFHLDPSRFHPLLSSLSPPRPVVGNGPVLVFIIMPGGSNYALEI